MGKTTTLTAKDGHILDAYVAEPKGKPRGAIVVLQEIFGVNPHMRDVADRFAGEGFTAVAPALFDRAQKGAELGYDKEAVEAGRALRGQIPLDQTLADIQAAIDCAGQFGKVAVIGFCFGGSMAFLSATRLSEVACAVGYYGGMVAQFAAEKPRVPVLLHFGELDHSIPMSDVERIGSARPDVEIHVYPAGHAFNRDGWESHHPDSATLAMQRTLAFLDKNLR